MSFFKQLCPDGLEIFEGVRQQVDLPAEYSAGHLKADMLVYLRKNLDYFTVNSFLLVEMIISCGNTSPNATFINEPLVNNPYFLLHLGFIRD